MNEHNSQLQIKLTANNQRRIREEYLAGLPADLSAHVEKCDYVQSPKLDGIVSMFCISPNGLVRDATDNGDITYFKPESYMYREMSWRDQVFNAANTIGDQHDQEMAFLYASAGPLYQVKFGWVRQNIAELFTCEWRISDFGGREKYCPEFVGVVVIDYSAGLILDSYCGYLEADPNPNEVIYEFANWGYT